MAQTKSKLWPGTPPTVWSDCAHCGAKVLREPRRADKIAFRSQQCSLDYKPKPKLEVVEEPEPALPPLSRWRRRKAPTLEEL
jgi:hypothetical protein